MLSHFGRAAYGNGIVKDGLILWLDAGNPTSYPGSGTTWTDLSGNADNGTLTNGPTFNSSNGGSIVFDGSNDYVTLNTSTRAYTVFTINTWIYISAYPGSYGICSIFDNGGYDNTTQQTYLNLVGSPYSVLRVGTYKAAGNVSYETTYAYSNLPLSTWHNICAMYDGASWKIFFNGTEVSSNTTTGPQTSTAPVSIGGVYISSGYQRFFNGRIAISQFYKRALSASEVTQNFNALRGRFGI